MKWGESFEPVTQVIIVRKQKSRAIFLTRSAFSTIKLDSSH